MKTRPHITAMAAGVGLIAALIPAATTQASASPQVDCSAARTARLGADLTGLPLNQIKNDPLANVCAGAAVLASHEPEDAGPDWLAVVMRYRGEAFSRQVAATLHSGQSRVTTDGQKVTLGAQTKVRVPAALKHAMKTDCPKRLDCK